MLTDYKHKQPVLVAYKGGVFKRELLRELGFDDVNIKFLGCPKVDKLKTIYLTDCNLQLKTV